MRGDTLLACWLREAGVECVFGVVGIPVVELASECQKVGIRFYSFHNEQTASYAAATYGYLTGKPGICLCVSGPGVVHSLAGVAHASINKWPMLLLGGSHKTTENYRGAFQEAPLTHSQMTTAFTKSTYSPSSPTHLRYCLTRALTTAVSGSPGPCYIELPENLLVGAVPFQDFGVPLQSLYPAPRPAPTDSPSAPYAALLKAHPPGLDTDPCLSPTLPGVPVTLPEPAAVAAAARTIARAQRPLVVVGKGACFSGAEGYLRLFVERLCVPWLPSPMARGILPDTHPLCVASARSAALAQADCVIIVGARMNWMFGFGNVLSSSAAIVHIESDPAEFAYLHERAQQGHGAMHSQALTTLSEEKLDSVQDSDAASPRGVPLHGIVGDCAATLHALAVALNLTTEPFRSHARNPAREEMDSAKTVSGIDASAASPLAARWHSWRDTLTTIATQQKQNLSKKTSHASLPHSICLRNSNTPVPIDAFLSTLSPYGAPPACLPHLSYDVLLGALGHLMPFQACLVTEGANTMDKARLHIPSFLPRRRLDATTFAAMGPALGAAVAAAVTYGAARPVVCVLGDSSMGFSAMEIETLVRYRLPVLIVVVNNNGIYSGRRVRDNVLRGDAESKVSIAAFEAAPAAADAVLSTNSPKPDLSATPALSSALTPAQDTYTTPLGLRVPVTALSPSLRYDTLARALGAHPASCMAATLPAFTAAVEHGLTVCVRDRLPVVVNALIAPEGAQAKLRSSDAFFGKKRGDVDAKL